MEIDETLQTLETLYQAIGGYENYEIWNETSAHDRSLEEIVASLEDEWGREKVGMQRIVDYWSDLHTVGLLDGNWQLNENGKKWAGRTQSSVQSLYMTHADLMDDRKNLGDIFYTLGTHNTLPTLHLLYQNEDISKHMSPSEIKQPLEVMHQHNFIQDEPYSKGEFGDGKKVLTERAETVYEEVVEPDYHWLKQEDLDL